MTTRKRKSSLSTKERGNEWSMVALFLGYNELVKKATTLSERMFFRMIRAGVEETLPPGVKIQHDPPVLLLNSKRPWIEFTANDIELMRKFLAEMDAPVEPTAVPFEPSPNCGEENALGDGI